MTKRMCRNEFADKLFEGKLTRREVAKALAGVGVGVAALPLVPGAAFAAKKHPLLFEWSGYELPEFHQAYIDKHGVSPDFSFFG